MEDRTGRVYLHITDTKMFRDCRRRWKFGSPRQLNLTPIIPDVKFWLGTGVHLGLQTYYQYLNDQEAGVLEDLARRALMVYDTWATDRVAQVQRKIVDIPEEKLTKLTDTAALGYGMLEHYFEWCPTVDNFKTVLVEHVFELPIMLNGKILKIPLPDGSMAELWFKGKIDAVVDTPDGRRWIVEHKTMASIWTEYYTLYDEQSAVYTYAAQETLRDVLGDDKPIDGVLYNLLRKKLPTVPEELVRGGLTKRKNIDTTYDVYMSEIRRLGLNPAEYKDILDMLQDKGNRFFRREPAWRSPEEIHEVILRIYHIAKDMFNNPVVYPTPDFFKCRTCSFQTVCVAMSNGADWKFILDRNYEQRPEEETFADTVVEPFEVLDAE